MWWAGSFDSRHSALSRLLFARGEDADVPALGASRRPTTPRWPGWASSRTRRPGASPSSSPARPAAALEQRAAPPAPLAVAEFDRAIDARWRRTSYSDITPAAHEPLVASEPEAGVLADEHAGRRRAPRAGRGRRRGGAGADAALLAVASPLAAMPAGMQVGTFVHRLLQARTSPRPTSTPS